MLQHVQTQSLKSAECFKSSQKEAFALYSKNFKERHPFEILIGWSQTARMTQDYAFSNYKK
jgi:hypothetical protein